MLPNPKEIISQFAFNVAHHNIISKHEYDEITMKFLKLLCLADYISIADFLDLCVFADDVFYFYCDGGIH